MEVRDGNFSWRADVKARLLFIVSVLALAAGCAHGYYEPQTAYQPEPTQKWYKNPETEQEYLQRLWWMQQEDYWPRRWRR